MVDDSPLGCDIEEVEPTLDLNVCYLCMNEEEQAG